MILIRSASFARSRLGCQPNTPSSEDRGHRSNRLGRLLRECENFTEVRDGSHRERNQLRIERIGYRSGDRGANTARCADTAADAPHPHKHRHPIREYSSGVQQSERGARLPHQQGFHAGREAKQPGQIDAGIFAHQARVTPDNRLAILVTPSQSRRAAIAKAIISSDRRIAFRLTHRWRRQSRANPSLKQNSLLAGKMQGISSIVGSTARQRARKGAPSQMADGPIPY